MSNTPKLRFPEFSGEWEEKNFYEVFDILQNNTFSRDQPNNENGIVRNIHYGDVLIKYGDCIDCQKEELPFINLENNLSKYEDTSYVKNGDIIIADTAEDYTAGKVTEICNVKDYKILSELHTFLCRTKFEFASKFLGCKLNSGSYHNQIAPLVAGTKVYSINRKAIGETTITYPSKAEQQKIADFLSNVDSIITAETKNLNTLQKKEKALMQKLFTQQLRFKSDDGTNFPTREEKKLGEIAIFSKGNGYSKSDLVSNGTPIILYGRLYTKYETVISDVDTFVQEKKNSVISVGNEIIAPASGETAEDISRASAVKHNGVILGGGLNIIEVDLNHYIPEFIALCISNGEPKKRKAKLAQGKTIVYLHNSDLQQLIFSIPCKAEQQKIADCLSRLDSLIQTQQKVVTTWQQRKKALLQQMFI